jgi:hypothetical protein
MKEGRTKKDNNKRLTLLIVSDEQLCQKICWMGLRKKNACALGDYVYSFSEIMVEYNSRRERFANKKIFGCENKMGKGKKKVSDVKEEAVEHEYPPAVQEEEKKPKKKGAKKSKKKKPRKK